MLNASFDVIMAVFICLSIFSCCILSVLLALVFAAYKILWHLSFKFRSVFKSMDVWVILMYWIEPKETIHYDYHLCYSHLFISCFLVWGLLASISLYMRSDEPCYLEFVLVCK